MIERVAINFAEKLNLSCIISLQTFVFYFPVFMPVFKPLEHRHTQLSTLALLDLSTGICIGEHFYNLLYWITELYFTI